jgi:hypothetical protein
MGPAFVFLSQTMLRRDHVDQPQALTPSLRSRLAGAARCGLHKTRRSCFASWSTPPEVNSGFLGYFTSVTRRLPVAIAT